MLIRKIGVKPHWTTVIQKTVDDNCAYLDEIARCDDLVNSYDCEIYGKIKRQGEFLIIEAEYINIEVFILAVRFVDKRDDSGAWIKIHPKRLFTIPNDYELFYRDY
jgi:hypothetical protein